MKSLLIAVVMVVALSVASTGEALTWSEVGDAGELPWTAQVTPVGMGTDYIYGNFDYDNDDDSADMYGITVSSGFFSASTYGLTSLDTQLFLFDSAGMGVLANDDHPFYGCCQSAIYGTLSPGTYYLAISEYDADPVSSGGLIFPSEPNAGVHGPTGPGGGARITGWRDYSYYGSYGIVLNMPVAPEPLTIVLTGIGFAGLPFVRRMAKKVRGS